MPDIRITACGSGESREARRRRNAAGGLPGAPAPARTLPTMLERTARRAVLAGHLVLSRRIPLTLWLPTIAGAPCPSSPLIADPPAGDERLAPWLVTGLPLAWPALETLLATCAGNPVLAPGVIAGDDLRYWAAALHFAASLVARQQFLPGIAETRRRIHRALGAALCRRGCRPVAIPSPPACPPRRARSAFAEAPPDTPAAVVLEGFITGVVDAPARPPGKRAASRRNSPACMTSGWPRCAHRRPHERRSGRIVTFRRRGAALARAAVAVAGRALPPASSGWKSRREEGDPWQVRYLLQPADDPSLLVSAVEIWKARGKKAALLQRGETSPRDFLLAALGTAATLSPHIEASLHAAQPAPLRWIPMAPFHFLADTAPLLEGMGYGVLLPAWWTRRGAKLRLAARAKMTGTKKKLRQKQRHLAG